MIEFISHDDLINNSMKYLFSHSRVVKTIYNGIFLLFRTVFL